VKILDFGLAKKAQTAPVGRPRTRRAPDRRHATSRKRSLSTEPRSRSSAGSTPTTTLRLIPGSNVPRRSNTGEESAFHLPRRMVGSAWWPIS
jgi:hypothetical protein